MHFKEQDGHASFPKKQGMTTTYHSSKTYKTFFFAIALLF